MVELLPRKGMLKIKRYFFKINLIKINYIKNNMLYIIYFKINDTFTLT